MGDVAQIIDDVIEIIERDQAKTSTAKQDIIGTIDYNTCIYNHLTQFCYDLSGDFRMIITALDNIKQKHYDIKSHLNQSESTAEDFGLKLRVSQKEAYEMHSKLQCANQEIEYLRQCLCCCEKENGILRERIKERDYGIVQSRSYASTYEYDYSPKRNEDYDGNRLNFNYEGFNYGNKARVISQDEKLLQEAELMKHYYSEYDNGNRSGLTYHYDYDYDNMKKENDYNDNIREVKGVRDDIINQVECNADDIIAAEKLRNDKLNKSLDPQLDPKYLKQSDIIHQFNHNNNDNNQDKSSQQKQPVLIEEDNQSKLNQTNRINRINNIVLKAFENEAIFKAIKERMGNDFEQKITQGDVNEEYLKQVEDVLNEINQSQKEQMKREPPKRLQIASKAKKATNTITTNNKPTIHISNPRHDREWKKTQLKKEITDKKCHYREYPRGWSSSKDYFINNSPSLGPMNKSTQKITNFSNC